MYFFVLLLHSSHHYYGHVRMVSLPNHTLFLGKLEQVVNQYFVHILSLVTEWMNFWIIILYEFMLLRNHVIKKASRERSGSVVECLTQDQGAASSSLTDVTVLCPWAIHINPSLVLVQPKKTCPYITERLLMGHKESNQTKIKKQAT